MEQNPEFWSDAKTASKISQKKTKLQKTYRDYQDAKDALDDALDYFELAKSENDDETLEILFDESLNLKEHIQSLEIAIMLSNEHDDANAIVSIHPGAGGTESQDWASMLYRMYLRWQREEVLR